MLLLIVTMSVSSNVANDGSPAPDHVLETSSGLTQRSPHVGAASQHEYSLHKKLPSVPGLDIQDPAIVLQQAVSMFQGSRYVCVCYTPHIWSVGQ